MAIEFNVKGHDYRANKLSAMEQFHVSRKIGPIIPKLLPVFVSLAANKDSSFDIAALADVATPFMDGLAAMSNEDSEYVVNTCMGVVSRNLGGVWSPIYSKANNVIMASDIDVSSMLPIVINVIKDSLGPFINALLSGQSEAAPKSAGQVG